MDASNVINSNKQYTSEAKLIQLPAFKAGDVISAEVWNSLLNTIISTANTHSEELQRFPALLEDFTNLQNAWTDWHAKYSTIFDNVEIIASNTQNILNIYAGLADGLVHYGEEPPTNPAIRLWIRQKKADYSFVGISTADDGEIFNDYGTNKALSKWSTVFGSNNIAGVKAFVIQSYSNGTFTLDAVDGLAADDVFSVKCGESYINIGTITAVDVDTNTISIVMNEGNDDDWAKLIAKDFANLTEKHLFIIDKLDIGTTSFDEGQYARGFRNKAVLLGAYAEGCDNIAADRYAHAEGTGNIAYYCAHVEGKECKALGMCSHAENRSTLAKGDYSHVEGNLSKSNGIATHAEGYNTEANADYSHTEGKLTKTRGLYSHAEGQESETEGIAAHSEGKLNFANGNCSHAEGSENTVNAYNAHAEGWNNTANGPASHVGGGLSKSSENATYGFAHGKGAFSNALGQAAFGNYNIGRTNTVLEVGNGTSEENRSNAFEVYKDGSIAVGGVKITPAQLQKLLTLIG